jgi:hypothetical protein
MNLFSQREALSQKEEPPPVVTFCSLATFRRRPKLDATKPTEEDTLAVPQTPLSICCIPRTPARQICKSETVAHSRAPIPRPATPEYFVMST